VVSTAPWSMTEPMGLLIADDDPACRAALCDLLKPEGFRTYEAGSGYEAIEIARAEVVHLLLMDWQMPRMTGLEAFRVIKRTLGLLPCILMTGAPSKEFLLRAMAEEAFTVIEKPISPGLAVYTVRRVIEEFYHLA
jgi:CheY-like chemotaxis protein